MPATNKLTLIHHMPMVSNAKLLNLYEYLPLPIHFNFVTNNPITQDIRTTNLLTIGHSIISNYLQFRFTRLPPPWRHLLFKGRKVMETSLKISCLGALYMANSHSLHSNCRFKIAEAREKIFELLENTWAVYSVGMISSNELCPAANDVTEMQIQSIKIILIIFV
jgi:hypothetical protein